MQKFFAMMLTAGLLALMPMARATPSTTDDKLEGQWKLVVLAFGDDEFVIFKTQEADGKLTGEVLAAQPFLAGAKLDSIEIKGDSATVVFQVGGTPQTFKGSFVKEGDEAGRLLGTFRFREQTYPARIEKTEDEKVGPTGRSTLGQELRQALGEADLKARVAKLQEIVEKNAGKPSLRQVYATLLRWAPDAEMTAKQVEEVVDRWINEAKLYGEEWTNQVRLTALAALNDKKQYSDISLALAREAEKSLGPDASTEDEANVVKLYAAAAKLAGKADLAESLDARLSKLEEKLDTEYHEKVPPFKPDSFAGRRDPQSDRMVVFELFTGAQCPPCVAADVAFDALLKTYRPAELIALQYHLHIPGPDPLTNRASLGRAKYYGVNSTPSTFFNGKQAGQGGGGMAQSKAKYDQYRGIIDEALYGKKSASIDLRVKRQGDKIEIAAAAQATPQPKSPDDEETKKDADAKKAKTKKDTAKKNAATKGDAKKDDAKKAKDATDEQDEPKEEKQEPKLRLRLAVTEESVRYVGSNRVRFHHHLVRAFPGGVDGQELTDGKGEAKLSISLADVQEEISDYLDEYMKSGSFPNPLPPVELKGLSVVAFVQDDSDKSILHAVVVPVPEE